MRAILTATLVVLCSVFSLANTYDVRQGGFLDYDPGQGVETWTPRILGLAHPGGDPLFYGTTFSSASITASCNSACTIGSGLSIDLAMSGFTIHTNPYNGILLVGTLNLITGPIVLRSQSGTAIAKFTLTGNLEACTDATCSNELFSLNVNSRGYATFKYNLASGQLTVSSLTYALPEPSSIMLLGTGLVFITGTVRRRSVRPKSRSQVQS